MIWIEGEGFELKEKRTVGRPLESPFCSKESEEEFIRRGKAMLELYYRPGGDSKTRKDFVFNAGYAMSKTSFWSFIYLYYRLEHQMHDNLQGFLSVIRLNFGEKVSSDRTTLLKCVKMFDEHAVQFKNSCEKESKAEKDVQDTLRSHYQYVVKRWKDCLDALQKENK